MADLSNTEKRKTLKKRGMSVLGGSGKYITIHLNKAETVDVPVNSSKDTLLNIIKTLESQRNVKIDPLKYSLKNESQVTVNLSGLVKSLATNELWLSPPLEFSEKNKVFGLSLIEAVAKSPNKTIPVVLYKSFEFLDKERTLRTVGLFRLNGNKDDIGRIAAAFDESGAEYEYPSNTDPHVVTGVIKKYLMELKEPVIPAEFYETFMSISEMEENERIKKLKDALNRIPPAHFKVLRYMIEFLVKLCMYSSKNLITPSNISITWGQLLLREQKTSEKKQRVPAELRTVYVRLLGLTMIENFGEIFGMEEKNNVQTGFIHSTSIFDDNSSSSGHSEEHHQPLNKNAEGEQSLKSFVALLKNKSQTPRAPTQNEEEEDTPQPGGSQTSRIRRGTVSNTTAPTPTPNPLANFAMGLKNQLNTRAPAPAPPPPPAPATEIVMPPTTEGMDGIQKTWMKFVDEWKSKYSAEVQARQMDKEMYDKMQKQWEEVVEQNNKNAVKLRQECDNAERNLKQAEMNLSFERQKFQLELDNLKRERELLIDRYERELKDLRSLLEHAKTIGAQQASTPRAETSTAAQSPTQQVAPPAEQQVPERKISVSSRFKRGNTTMEAPALTSVQAPVSTPTPAPAPAPVAEPEPVDPSKACGKCGKEIRGEWMEANSKKFHPDCFSCFNCKQKITGSFAEKEGNAWCKDCIQGKPKGAPAAGLGSNKVCASCGEPCGPGDKLLALGKAYHKACFRCQECGSEFENMKFFNLNNSPVCGSCKKKVK